MITITASHLYLERHQNDISPIRSADQDVSYLYLTLGVVTLGPVVPGPGLTEDKVIRAEESPVGSTADTVHGAGLQVHQDSPGHVLPSAGLVVVHVDPLQLEVGLARVGASGVNPVFITTRDSQRGEMSRDRTYLMISQNLAPIWLPHWPAWTWTISLMMRSGL